MTRTPHGITQPAHEAPNVPGLDVAAGLRCVQGRPDRYAELLRRFVADQEGCVDEIRSALSGGDWQAAARVAHTSKSVAAAVGAQVVADLAAWLEVLIRGRQHTDQAVQALERALSRQLADIGAWLDSQQPSSHPAVARAPAASCSPSLARLEELLSADDAAAADFLRQQSLALHGALPAHFDRLQAAVWEFDFPLALRILYEARDGRCAR